MTADEIASIVAEHEMQRIELKESFDAECVETACAFANAHGGLIFIGVTYPTRTVESVAKLGLEPYHFGLEKTKDAAFVASSSVENGTDKIGMKTGMKTGMKITDAILNMIKEDPSVSIDRLALVTERARSSVQEAIGRLKIAGVIRRVGPDKGGHWEIVEKSSSNGGRDIGS